MSIKMGIEEDNPVEFEKDVNTNGKRNYPEMKRKLRIENKQ